MNGDRRGRVRVRRRLALGAALLLIVAACAGPAAQPTPAPAGGATPLTVPETGGSDPAALTATPLPAAPGATALPGGGAASYTPDVVFTLRTDIAEGRMAFVGVGGAIDGVVNPELRVNVGDVVQLTLINGDGAVHDIVVPDFGARSDQVTGKGASSTTVFRAGTAGEFFYFCSVPGHRQAGMEGRLVVGQAQATAAPPAASVARDPADVPAPVGDRAPQKVRFDLETVEKEGRLADNTTYTYWTFDGTVPGPLLRVRAGDTVEIHLKNAPGSTMIHSIDLHAATGPGGGAAVMQVPPGQEQSFTFKALAPGLYVYHCATPMVAQHITNGMYGLILVEPEGGLPPVDREFYVMEGELYTRAPFGQTGHQEFSVEKLLAEQPEYVVLNGAVGALTDEYPLTASTGQTVRIFFGVGGPNLTSSFHVIGEIFDRVYDQASLTSAPLTGVQTALVPAGGAVMVELKLDVPGRYILVDHSLSRLERGLVGFMQVDGPANPDVFQAGGQP